MLITQIISGHCGYNFNLMQISHEYWLVNNFSEYYKIIYKGDL